MKLRSVYREPSCYFCNSHNGISVNGPDSVYLTFKKPFDTVIHSRVLVSCQCSFITHMSCWEDYITHTDKNNCPLCKISLIPKQKQSKYCKSGGSIKKGIYLILFLTLFIWFILKLKEKGYITDSPSQNLK